MNENDEMKDKSLKWIDTLLLHVRLIRREEFIQEHIEMLEYVKTCIEEK